MDYNLLLQEAKRKTQEEKQIQDPGCHRSGEPGAETNLPSSKQKGPTLSSSLMHSESELDSDDAIFTWPDREKGKLLYGQNGSVPNGQTPLKSRSAREEIL